MSLNTPNYGTTSPIEADPVVRRVEAGEDLSPEPIITTNRSKLGSAARLPHFISRWQQVTNNKFILRIIQEGYKIDFITKPEQAVIVSRQQTPENIEICQYKIKRFLANGAIIVVQPSPDQFISNIFPVVKQIIKMITESFLTYLN